MTAIITKAAATAIARQFVEDYVNTGRQWGTRALEDYLPRELGLRDGADYAGPATITDITAFLRSETISL